MIFKNFAVKHLGQSILILLSSVNGDTVRFQVMFQFLDIDNMEMKYGCRQQDGGACLDGFIKML